MPALTPDERRGGLLVALLLLIGAGWDAWRAATVPPPPVARPGAVQDAMPEPPPGPAPRAATPETAAAVRRLDLNRATTEELDALPGIGPVLARRIVEHRERHGAFRSLEELRAVRGVGPRLLDRLRPRLHAGR